MPNTPPKTPYHGAETICIDVTPDRVSTIVHALMTHTESLEKHYDELVDDYNALLTRFKVLYDEVDHLRQQLPEDPSH